ncbi:MAG: hypothetical protein U0936_02145 [Planctomycetaceae bacterium]
MKDVLADILPPPSTFSRHICLSTLAAMAHDRVASPADGGCCRRSSALQKQYEDRHEFWSQTLNEGEIKSKIMRDTCAIRHEF